MALKNQPEFEEFQQTFDTDAAPEVTINPASIPEAKVPVVAPQSTASVTPYNPPAFTTLFQDKHNFLSTEIVGSLSRSAPRITAEQGAVYQNRKDNHGAWIKIDVLSFNRRWAIGCGVEKQTEETKKLFRSSYDKVTVYGEGDESVEDYVNNLKAMGYGKAGLSEYGDLWGMIVETEKKGVIPEDQREICLVQLSQTSLSQFIGFCASQGLLVSKGVFKAPQYLKIKAEAQESKGNRYTNFSFAPG